MLKNDNQNSIITKIKALNCILLLTFNFMQIYSEIILKAMMFLINNSKDPFIASKY